MAPESLSVVHAGAGDGRTPLTLLHGFTQSATCWGTFMSALAAERNVAAIDLPGHGGSAEIHADLPTTAELVADAIEPSVVVGYSLGGRVALHLALARPDLIERLVLISTTGGIDDAEERSERRAADERLAARIEDIGVDAFLDEWLAQPLFRGLTPETALRECRRSNTPAGLAASLRRCGTGTQDPLWGRLSTIDAPVLIVVGADDAKFRDLGDRLRSSIGANAEIATIDDTGHNAPLERPGTAAETILNWLAST